MSEEPKKIKVTFAPGAFDSFDGTQEELNELMAEIIKMAESGELMEQGQLVDMDDFIEDEEFSDFMSNTSTRILQ